MKSTIKIDTSVRGVHQVPTLKIIQPDELFKIDNDLIEDVKDKLLLEWLHTPVMKERNMFFVVDSHYPHPLENPTVHITTISAIEKDQLLNRMQNLVFNKIMSDSDLFDSINFEREVSKQATSDSVIGPIPNGYEKYQKVKDFFMWVEAKSVYFDNGINN